MAFVDVTATGAAQGHANQQPTTSIYSRKPFIEKKNASGSQSM